jgi:hypothetical protein
MLLNSSCLPLRQVVIKGFTVCANLSRLGISFFNWKLFYLTHIHDNRAKIPRLENLEITCRTRTFPKFLIIDKMWWKPCLNISVSSEFCYRMSAYKYWLKETQAILQTTTESGNPHRIQFLFSDDGHQSSQCPSCSFWNILAEQNTEEVSAFMMAHFFKAQECHTQLLLGIWSFPNQSISIVHLNFLFYIPKMIPHHADSRSILNSHELPARNRKTDSVMTISRFLRHRISPSSVESWE